MAGGGAQIKVLCLSVLVTVASGVGVGVGVPAGNTHWYGLDLWFWSCSSLTFLWLLVLAGFLTKSFFWASLFCQVENLKDFSRAILNAELTLLTSITALVMRVIIY